MLYFSDTEERGIRTNQKNKDDTAKENVFMPASHHVYDRVYLLGVSPRFLPSKRFAIFSGLFFCCRFL